MSISFFIELEKIPKTTAQQKKVRIVNNIPLFYDHPNLKLAKSIFIKELAKYKPNDKLTGAISLKILWQFEKTKKSKDGEYKITRPDLDNLNKGFQDCLTKTGFFKDDSQVVELYTTKKYSDKVGIYVEISELREI